MKLLAYSEVKALRPKRTTAKEAEAIVECEHCGLRAKINGFDTEVWRHKVLPTLVCAKCGRASENANF